MSSFFGGVMNRIQDKWSNDKKGFSLYAGCVALVLVPMGVKYYKYASEKKMKQKLKQYEDVSTKENKVILHTFHQWALATPNPSPACAKMIAFLECNKIDYILDNKMPLHPDTKKAPWITYKNEHIPDSNMIIDYISNNKALHNINMDHHLDKVQKATCNAFKALIEDCLYYIILYRRWCTDENFKVYFELLFNKFLAPSIVKLLIRSKIQKLIIAQTWSQGTARLPSKYIYAKGEQTVQSVVEYMGDNKFFFGEKISTLDLSIYGHISGMYQVPFTWNNDTNKSLPYRKEINEYMKRIEMQCYNELRYWKDIV